MIKVCSANSHKCLTDFINVPNYLYQDDENYVQQLTMERKEHLNPKKNPFFDHADCQLFVAYNPEGKPVGRISAQVDHQEEDSKNTGHFGCLEAADETTLRALLIEAEEWLRGQGIKKVTGPYSLSINDEVGLLVEGFDSSARLLMNYAKPWYAKSLEKDGYKKVQDLFAYNLEVANPFPANAKRMAKYAMRNPKVQERAIDVKNLDQELKLVMDIFNDAWSNNWGFTPMTAEEISYMAKNLKPLIDPDLARIISVDGKSAGMIIALPDVNEAIKDLKGSLFPFGWLKLLWRLKVRGTKGGRVVLMGIRKEHQGTTLGGALAAALVVHIHEIGQKKSFEQVELSWILEDNKPMSKIIEFVGGTLNKKYRIYEKGIA